MMMESIIHVAQLGCYYYLQHLILKRMAFERISLVWEFVGWYPILDH